jgi:hypothetical protein
MPASEPRLFKSASAFRTSVDAQLKARQRELGPPTTVQLLRRRFLQERLLARVFADPSAPWALKGGVGMLVRIPPRARYSKDIDLVHLPADPQRAAEDLARLVQIDVGDLLRFQIVRSVTLSTDAALRVTVEVYTGTTKWDEFPIDVSCELHYVGELEHRHHAPVLPPEKSGLTLPEFVLYPVVDQIADKVAAMYERHGESASNRWRDLADLVLLVTDGGGFDAAELNRALAVRQQVARSPLTLPEAMHVPGSEWRTGYPSFAAKETFIPARFHDLDEALQLVGGCLDPVLGGRVGTGRWDPAGQQWADGAAG